MTLSKLDPKKAAIDAGERPGVTSTESAENCARLKKPGPAVGAGERGAAPRGGVSRSGVDPKRMMYPLVRELAARWDPRHGVVSGTRSRSRPVLSMAQIAVHRRQLDEAYLANAIFDAHRDDPEFGYRFLADEVRRTPAAPRRVSDRVVWRICARPRLVVGRFGKPKRSQGRKAGHAVARRSRETRLHRRRAEPAVVERTSRSIARARARSTVCAIKDVYSNRIVGWAIDERMKARLVVAALEMAVARRGDVAGCILHSDRGSQFRAQEGPPGARPPRHGRIHGPSRLRRRQRRHGIVLRAPTAQRPRHGRSMGHPRRPPHRDHHLDRTHLPPTPTTEPASAD